jgi:hypothetical protein
MRESPGTNSTVAPQLFSLTMMFDEIDQMTSWPDLLQLHVEVCRRMQELIDIDVRNRQAQLAERRTEATALKDVARKRRLLNPDGSTIHLRRRRRGSQECEAEGRTPSASKDEIVANRD